MHAHIESTTLAKSTNRAKLVKKAKYSRPAVAKTKKAKTKNLTSSNLVCVVCAKLFILRQIALVAPAYAAALYVYDLFCSSGWCL